MLAMTAEFKKGDLDNLLKMYSKDMVRKSLRSALDKTGTWGKNYLANDVAQNFNISSSRAKKEMKVKRTTQTTLEAAIIISKKRLSLINFGAYQDEVGVKVPFSKTKTYDYPHAFINRRSGNKFIAIRKTKKRYQVSGKPGRGPSIATLIDRIGNRDKRDAALTNHLYEEVSNQIAKRTMTLAQIPSVE